ncbi:hypothetical protein N5U04_03925 [Aliarcobacter butzleri]|uniref:hypothetical protein n=1 Tax=Aliarcobacter butzleri TaxID=28197 RepID=UPI0021B34750|nr:hypothetical protein [Aliarcobacter butzleri]MCT7549619.1 hypothetical protein [Aliarcobacter butzleri]MCT7558720.1 hypothetical protein [Aliarcobacter butzleri]MDN5044876.1 hypothetical protein [Aliarcobacter butzleri]UXC29252.1 hypothetical protein N3114_11435 [Aliarcobacter butzleri]
MKEVINNLTLIPLNELVNKRTQNSKHFIFSENINPYNLYIYLNARFGKPNGVLSLIRQEDSDQLFHWHYSLKYKEHRIEIMCATYRLEIFISNKIVKNQEECLLFLNLMIEDSSSYKYKILEVKKDIENWIQIINPFYKLMEQIRTEFEEIDKIEEKISKIDLKKLKNRNIDSDIFTEWLSYIDSCSTKSFSIRCLIPVYVETFINLILYFTLPEDLKKDKDKFDLIIKKKINERFLEINNCRGIINKVSDEDIYWKNVHKIFNNRNDLLHGNINMKRLKINEVFFIDKMPLFKSFGSFEKDFKESTFYEYKQIIDEEIEQAQDFFYYILFSFEKEIRLEIKSLIEIPIIGFNEQTKRFGILFPSARVDYDFK